MIRSSYSIINYIIKVELGEDIVNISYGVRGIEERGTKISDYGLRFTDCRVRVYGWACPEPVEERVKSR
jgi:hypothetical protein